MRRLLVNYRAADLTPELLTDGTVCHVLDVYHRHAIEKVHHARAICSPHLPEGPWDEVWFKTGPKLLSGELSLDLLQECARLTDGDLRPPRFRLDFVGRERDRNDLLDKVKGDPARVRSFRAEWPASVPGGPKLMFSSYPGCFCHRRLDEGGLALAEVVSRDLLSARTASHEPRTTNHEPRATNHEPRATNHEPSRLLLDMGCGCGLVGFLVRSVCANVGLTMVDSHSRAVEAANENAAKFGFPAEVILSDGGTPARLDGAFDVFVGNPPYYSDYRIADVFLETAKCALKPGGVCYTVCKNAAGLEPVQKRYFPDVEIIRRRGYAVLKSKQ